MLAIIIFAVISGVLLDVLVALFGSRRNIGFGWAFIISILFSPLIGAIAVLLSDPLPQGSAPKYGCLGFTFGVVGMIFMILFAIAAMLGVFSLLIPLI